MVADALSRMLEVESLSFTKIKISLLDNLRGQYEHDQSYKEVWKSVLRRDPSPMDSAQLVANNATPTQASTATSNEMQRWKKNSTTQGLLLHKGTVCVPSDNDIRLQILYECHDSPSAGHPGIRKTYALVRSHFYWPQMHKSIEHYVVHCQQCQVNKA